MEHYDVCIIGAGPSGYAAAMRGWDFKKKVLLIERSRLGGSGVTNGALSSKTWWEIARETASFRNKLARHQLEMPEVPFEEIKKEVMWAKNKRLELLEKHMGYLHDIDPGEYLFHATGKAFIVNPNTIEITPENGESAYQVSTDYIILATGSRPRRLPNIPIDEKYIVTSNGIEEFEDYPESMVILGAGVIGCEYATIFSNLGRTRVYLIDKGDRILPFEDEDVVEVIERNLEQSGVVIHRNSQLVRMKTEQGQVVYELLTREGKRQTYKVERALVSVGRVPNLEGLWSESVPIKLTSRGFIDDNQTQTSVPNIYAVGDLTADIALVNVGELEGRYAIERIFGKPQKKLIYENVSTIMFLNPEVAGVGLNEIQAKQKGMEYRVVRLDYSCIPRAIAKRNTQGFIKILVSNDEQMKILGMRVVGQHASSAIQAVALLISMDKGIEELAELIHPHPSIIEGIQECVRMFLGKSMFKPRALQKYMQCECYADGKYQKIS